jgi:hypothetical protein
MALTPSRLLGGDKGVRQLGERNLCSPLLALLLYRVLALGYSTSVVKGHVSRFGQRDNVGGAEPKLGHFMGARLRKAEDPPATTTIRGDYEVQPRPCAMATRRSPVHVDVRGNAHTKKLTSNRSLAPHILKYAATDFREMRSSAKVLRHGTKYAATSLTA